jgi:hypothetical protein
VVTISNAVRKEKITNQEQNPSPGLIDSEVLRSRIRSLDKAVISQGSAKHSNEEPRKTCMHFQVPKYFWEANDCLAVVLDK